MTQDKPAALAEALAKVSAINAREAERLRLAALERARKAKLRKRGMA